MEPTQINPGRAVEARKTYKRENLQDPLCNKRLISGVKVDYWFYWCYNYVLVKN